MLLAQLRASAKCSDKCEVRHTGARWRVLSHGYNPRASCQRPNFGVRSWFGWQHVIRGNPWGATGAHWGLDPPNWGPGACGFKTFVRPLLQAMHATTRETQVRIPELLQRDMSCTSQGAPFLASSCRSGASVLLELPCLAFH